MVNIYIGLCGPKGGWISCNNSVEAVVQFAGILVDASDAEGIEDIVASVVPPKKELVVHHPVDEDVNSLLSR